MRTAPLGRAALVASTLLLGSAALLAITLARYDPTGATGNQGRETPAGTSGLGPSVLLVNHDGDAPDAAPGDGACATAELKCTLRAALQEANASSGTDSIEVGVTGVITLEAPLPTIIEGVSIAGPGAGHLAVDAAGTGRVFAIDSPANEQKVAISGLTVSGGRGSSLGGGIFVASGDTLNLSSMIVTGNKTSSLGGGIAALGTLSVSDSSITNNEAANSGGGIYNSGHSETTIRNSRISDNNAYALGGGITNVLGLLTLTDTTISGNSAGASGGGIANVNSLGPVCTADCESTVTGTNLTISSNTADVAGGGVLNTLVDQPAEVNLTSTTITGNTADHDGDGSGGGGGIANASWSRVGQVSLKNTILAANSDTGGESPDCSSLVTSKGFNLIGDTNGCDLTGDTSSDITNGGAGLGPLADNGGLTLTHALLPGSPAIDAGSGACPPPKTDQRGRDRPADGDEDGLAACDIGAYEANAKVPTATPTLSPLPAPTEAPSPTATATPDPCPWDVNASGSGDSPDIAQLVLHFGHSRGLDQAQWEAHSDDLRDMDGDEMITAPDLVSVVQHFGEVCPSG